MCMIENIKVLKTRLETEIKKCSNVFIVGHNSPDFDAIGSAIGLYVLARRYGKKSYIIVDDDEIKIEPGVKRIIDSSRDEYNFITRNDFLEKVNNNSLLIVTDVNKINMISVGEDLDIFGHIIVIDHHLEDESTIPTEDRFISLETSSASEIVSRVLLLSKTPFNNEVANYLLAGISLDTKRFKQNTTGKTHDTAEHLMDDRGASMDYVNSLFLEEFASAKRINNLIFTDGFTRILKYSEDPFTPIQVSFTINREEPKAIYAQEDYAKAADRMLKFTGIDASFALGYIDDEIIHISSRGGKRVNVGTIMEAMPGQCGGNAQSAGGRIKTDDIDTVERELVEKVKLGLSDEVSVMKEPPLIKIKKREKMYKKSI